jgi:hypothetical protein
VKVLDVFFRIRGIFFGIFAFVLFDALAEEFTDAVHITATARRGVDLEASIELI